MRSQDANSRGPREDNESALLSKFENDCADEKYLTFCTQLRSKAYAGRAISSASTGRHWEESWPGNQHRSNRLALDGTADQADCALHEHAPVYSRVSTSVLTPAH